MGFKFLKSTDSYRIVSVSIIVAFSIWMLFLDSNSYLYHRKLNHEIENLRDWIDYHQKKIDEDKLMIQKLKDPDELERYARERYLMRKKNEDIYIIEFDTIKH